MVKQIGYDIDGCIVDSAPYFTMALMQKYDLTDIRHLDKNGHETFYFKLKGVDSDEVSDLINFTIVKYHHIMDEVQGAIDAVRWIHAVTGEAPIYLTARAGYYDLMDKAFHNWLSQENLPKPYIYKRVESHGDKIHAVKHLGLSHYVEDRYKNAHDLAPYLTTVYLMDKTYNDRPIKARNIKRVYSWTEIVDDYLKGD